MACLCCERYAPKHRDGSPLPMCETERLLSDLKAEVFGSLAEYHALAKAMGRCGRSLDKRCLACNERDRIDREGR
jgi:hypothetical protein